MSPLLTRYATPGQKVAGHLRDAVPPLGLVRADVPRPIAGLLERMLAKNAAERPSSPSEVANLLAPFCEGSKLIGLLREARRAGPAPEAEQASRLDTAALHVGSVETSREEAGEPEEASEPQAAGNFGPYHRRLGSPMRIAAMVGGVLAALLLGVVIAFQTHYGTVMIKIPEGVSNVAVKLDGRTIWIEGLDRPLRLRPGEHELLVDSDGFETYTRSFTVKRGDNVVLSVTLVPLDSETAEVAKAMMPSVTDAPTAPAPPLAIAPFDADEARRHQEAWASHLGVPVELENSIGMKLRLIPPGEFMMGSPESEGWGRWADGDGPMGTQHVTGGTTVTPESLSRK